MPVERITAAEAEKITCGNFQKPHGWIQWKGTNVCIDIRCECGANHHFDGDFLYYWKCPTCKTVFAMDPHVRMIPLSDEPRNCVQTSEDE